MAEYLTNTEDLTSVANKIRQKTGGSSAITFPNGFNSAIDTLTKTSDATASASDILSGKTAYVNGSKLTGTMTNRGTVSGSISTKAGQYTIPNGYHSGSGSVSIASAEQAKIIPENIKQGINILGVDGSLSPTPEPPDPSTLPVYFEMAENGPFTNYIIEGEYCFCSKYEEEYEINFEISYDNITWISAGCNCIEIDLSPLSKKGDRVYIRADMDKVTSFSESENYGYLFSDVPINVGGNIKSLANNSNNCFVLSYFFNGCMYLVDAKNLILPFTTLCKGCYFNLFGNCRYLTSVPTLPATTLAECCYSYMFSGCTSLTSTPSLPATTLTRYCYDSMFKNCISLTCMYSLPATTLAEWCYNSMFEGCIFLTDEPALPATRLTKYCYHKMFSGCTSLTSGPSLPATTLAEWCYGYMFYGCTSLTFAPTLPATTLAHFCYNNMFRGCTSLTSAPTLPATTLAIACYSSMFSDCTSLTSAPSLPATTLAISCYGYMFKNCINLTSAPSLPAITLAKTCYDGMFYGCKSLFVPPNLPATILQESCYESMFRGCNSILLSSVQNDFFSVSYKIPSSGTGTYAASCLLNMFKETRGSFTATPEINTTYYYHP